MTQLGRILILLACGLTVLMGWVLCLAGVSLVRASFVGVNVATILAYGYDKQMACTERQRVPEAALHILSAAGGTPGAFIGQMLFRHKLQSGRFRVVFFSIAAVQISILLAIFYLRKV